MQVESVSATPVARSSTPPAAKDGQNYKACADGNCEVLIRGSAVITVYGVQFTFKVAGDTFDERGGDGFLHLSGTGGPFPVGGFTGASPTLKVPFHEGDTAVVAITTVGTPTPRRLRTPIPGASPRSTTPTPTKLPIYQPADGTNYEACRDGQCEVLLHRSARITIGKLAFDFTVANGAVHMLSCKQDNPLDCYDFHLDGSGGAGWADEPGGVMYDANLKAYDGEDAVLSITTE
ncbi:hypothetical protein EV645_1891 [Kribbella rubisoli]|uniref:Uncharacterized protein n=1 Tax=Kribbella rubisoli TaxID=3075929 RepID=A0A4Q7X9E0_9ACTN|nr:hypothetical protein EV645_1891 [Kribbella rubisoli]